MTGPENPYRRLGRDRDLLKAAPPVAADRAGTTDDATAGTTVDAMAPATTGASPAAAAEALADGLAMVTPGATPPSLQRALTGTLQDRIPDDVIVRLRRALRRTGKEHSSYRLLDTEKQGLKAILRQWEGHHYQASENDLVRIAVGYLLADYEQWGDAGIVMRVLRELEDEG